MATPSASGTKFSRKGSSVYAALCATRSHPSAESLYQTLLQTYPNLSRSTVYTNLNRLQAQGRVVCVGVVDGSERYDADTSSHPHFFCDGCGAVLDLQGLPRLPELMEAAEAENRVRVHGLELRFHGLCQDCLSRQEQAR